MNRNQITKGRPLDNMLEKEFKEKVREKYQTICSECQLEMSLAEHDIQEDRALNSELFDHSDQNLQVLFLQIGLENEKKMWMHQRFCFLRDQWIFEDIKCGQSLPEYLFHGKSDLSYILHRVQAQFFQAEPALETASKRFKENPINIDFQSSCQKISQSKSLPSSPLFEAEELMFLFLLCIKQRKMLSQPIIQYYQENMKIFTELMKRGLEKIKKKISSKQNLEEEEINIDKYLNLQSQAKDHQKVRKINKKIYKPQHKKSKKEKNVSSQDKSASQMQKAYDLCIKSVNYICWAYWYILNKNAKNQ